ncbi:MAG: tetratricopeptide repeat protein [Bradymonadia bacterium]|jgi:tetratricopeptide (TPR) repeat protein
MENYTKEHFVEELGQLLASRSYEAFYDRVQEEMPQLREQEQLCLSLHCADNVASLLGMPGITAESLMRIFYIYPNNPLIEDRLLSHLKSTNNFNLLARALQHKIDLESETQAKSLAYLEFGHFLRFSADDHIEAARSYYTSATLSIEYALPGIISLQRLNRSDPSCNEAKQAIARLKAKLKFSEEQISALQLELNHSSLGDKRKRSTLLLHLATLHLQLWGDANKAIDFIEPALELTKDNHAASFAILNDLALAMPDSLPTLRRISEILWTYERWKDVVRIGELEWKLIPRAKKRTKVLLDMAQIYAEHIDNPDEARRRLYLASAFFAEYVSQYLSTHGWVYDYALKREGFRDTVLLLIEESGDPNLAIKYWDFMSQQQSDKALKDEALIEKWRLESAQAKSSDAIVAMIQEGIGQLSIAAIPRIFDEISLYLPQLLRPIACLNLLSELGERSGNWEKLLSCLQTWLSYPLETQLRIEILKLSAQINEQHLKDYKQAARNCLSILGIEPLNTFALQRIDHIFSSSFSQEDSSEQSVEELLSKLAVRVESIGPELDQSTHNMAILQLAGDINALARRNVNLNDYAQEAAAIFEPLFERYKNLPGNDEFSTKIALQLIKLLQQLQYFPKLVQEFVSQKLEQSHLNLGLLERMVEIIEPMGQDALLERALVRCLEEAETAEQSQRFTARLVHIDIAAKRIPEAVERLLNAIAIQGSAESTRDMLNSVFSLQSQNKRDNLALFDALLAGTSPAANDDNSANEGYTLYLPRIADWLYHQIDDKEYLERFHAFVTSEQVVNDQRLIEAALILEKCARFDEAKSIYEALSQKDELDDQLRTTIYENHASLLLSAYNDIDAASAIFDKIIQQFPVEHSEHEGSVSPQQPTLDAAKKFSNEEALASHLQYCLSLGGPYLLLEKLGLSTLKGKQLRKQANLVKLLIKQNSAPAYQENLTYLFALLCESSESYDEAALHYEELRQTKRFELDALLGLVRVLRSQKNFEQIPEIIEDILLHNSAQHDLSAVFMIYAETLQELKAPPLTIFNRLKQAHFMLADDQELSNLVYHFAIEHKLYDELVEMLHEDAALALDDETKAKHFLNIAEIVKRRLHAPMLAFDALCSAFMAYPQTTGLLEQIEELAAEENNFSELIAFYRMVLNSEKHEEFHLNFLLKTAEVYAQRLNNALNAFETCCDIIRRYPNSLEAVALMENIAQSHSRFDLLVSFYSLIDDKLLSRRSKVDRFMVKAGLSLAEPMKLPKGLVHTAMLLVIDPNNNAVIYYLNAELQSMPSHWETVTQTMLNLQLFSPSPSSLIQTAASIYADRLDNPEKGFNALLTALPENISNPGYFQQATALAERTNKHHHILAILDDVIIAAGNDLERRNDLLAKKFQIADLIGDDLVKLRTLHEILQENPDDDFAIQQIKDINVAQLKSQARILFLQLQMRIEKEPQELLAKQFQIADYYIRSLQYNNAINLYQEILDENPRQLQAHYELYKLFYSLENWKSAENTLLNLINLEDDQIKNFQNLMQLAALQDQKLLVPSRALLSLFAALDIFPDFEQLHPLLLALCLKLQSFSPLIDKYQDLAMHSESLSVKRAAILHIADIYIEYLNDAQSAKELYERWLSEEGKSDSAYIEHVAQFYRQHNDWQSYLKTLLLKAEQCEDLLQKSNALYRVSMTFADQFYDYENAAHYMLDAIKYDNENPDLWLALAQFYLAKEETLNAIEALKHAELYQDNLSKLPTLTRLTQLHIELKMLSEALRYFSEAADLNPPLESLAPFILELQTLSLQRQELGSYAQIWEKLHPSLPPNQLNDYAISFATTLLQNADFSEQRQAVAQNILSFIKAPSAEQVAILNELQSSTLEPNEAIDYYQNALNNPELTPTARIATLKALRLAALTVDDLLLVQSVSEAILALTADDTEVAYDLIQLYYHSGKWDLAMPRIEEMLGKLNALDYEEAAFLHYYYADILYASQEADAALQQLDQAVSLMPDFRAAVDLRLNLLLEKKAWTLALPEFYTLLHLSDDVEVQGAIQKRIGELYEFYLDEPLKAIDAYEIALVLGGDVDDLPLRLLPLYIQQEQWDKAAMTAEAIAEAQTETKEAKIGYLLSLAEICHSQLHDDHKAINTLQQAFELDPLHPETLSVYLKIISPTDSDSIQNIAQTLLNIHYQAPYTAGLKDKINQLYQHLTTHDITPKIQADLRRIIHSSSPLIKPVQDIVAPKLVDLPLIDLDDVQAPTPPSISSFGITFPDTTAIKELSFSMDDLQNYWQFFHKHELEFGLRIVQDLLAIVAPEQYKPAPLRPLPERITPIAREKLLEGQVLPAAVLKTILALSLSPNSPALYSDSTPLRPINLNTYPQIHAGIRKVAKLLDIEVPQIISAPQSLPNPGLVLNTLPAALIVEAEELENMSEIQWLTRCAYSCILALPTNILFASKSITEIHDLYQLVIATLKMNEDEVTRADIVIQNLKQVLSDAKISALTGNIIAREDANSIRRAALQVRSNASHVALQLSQSLFSCVEFYSSQNNMWFPRSINTLKSNLKRNPELHELLLYALTKPAQLCSQSLFNPNT